MVIPYVAMPICHFSTFSRCASAFLSLGSFQRPGHTPLAIWNPPESANMIVFGSRLRTMSSLGASTVKSKLACPAEYKLHLYGNNPSLSLSQLSSSMFLMPAGMRSSGTNLS